MGHSTCGYHGRRTCDNCDACLTCDKSGARLRKFSCPIGWCSPFYLCPKCIARDKHKVDHEGCKTASARAQARDRAQADAAQRGAAVVRAGVRLPNGRVFAWTTTRGNFEVDADIYAAAIAREDHALDITNATPRAEAMPPEVYGPKAALQDHVTGAIERGVKEAVIEQPALPGAAHVRGIENATPQFDQPFALTAPPHSGSDASQRGLFQE